MRCIPEQAQDDLKAGDKIMVGEHEIEIFETRYDFEITVKEDEKVIMHAVGGEDKLETVIALMEDAIRGE